MPAAARGPASRHWGHDEAGRLQHPQSLQGFAAEVRIDGLLAQERLRVGDHSTALITPSDPRAQMRRGDDALAIIKSTEVMIARARGAKSKTVSRKRRQSPAR